MLICYAVAVEVVVNGFVLWKYNRRAAKSFKEGY